MKILLIEDEAKVASFISKGLEEEGYQVDVAFNGREGLDFVDKSTYDMVLLDLMIPEIPGLDVLKHIRGRGMELPVLIITAKSSKEDVVKGLDTGSDDYLTKPFSFEELLARMRALLRRRAAKGVQVLRYGDIELDTYNRTLSIQKKSSELTEKEFLIIELLMKRSENALTRKEIAEYVWENATDSTNIVDVYINFLRKKIESISQKKYIHTVRGIGYIMKEER